MIARCVHVEQGVCEECRRRAERDPLDALTLEQRQVITRGPGNPLFDAEMRRWAQLDVPASSAQSVPGTMEFTVLERKS